MSNISLSSTGTVIDTAPFRRKTSPKIAELRSDLSQSTQTDMLTQFLQEICDDFTKELQSIYRPQLWEERLVETLKRALIDDLTNLPCEELYLGSDGYVYGKTLALYFDSRSEEFQKVSPLTGEEAFYIESHYAANACIKWLKKYYTFSEPQEIVEAYCALQRSGYAVPLPTKHNFAIREGLWRQVQMLKAQQDLIEEIETKLDILEIVGIPEVESRIAELYDLCDQADMKIITQLNALDPNRRQKALELAAELAVLNEENAQFEERNRVLDETIGSVEVSIQEAKQEVVALKEAVREAEGALIRVKKAKKNKILRAVIFNVANIGIAVFTGASLLGAVGYNMTKGVVSYAIKSTKLAPQIKTILNGAVQGGLQAGFSGARSIAEGVIRGNGVGIASVALSQIGPKNPLISDAMQSVTRGMIASYEPNTMKNMAADAVTGSLSGGVSRQVGIPISLAKAKTAKGATTFNVQINP